MCLHVLQVLLLATAIGLGAPLPDARAQDAATDVNFNTSGGYGRLVFRFNDDNEAEVRLSGAVLVIAFKNRADIDLDRLVAAGSEYISAARRDPDGRGLRVALTRQVTVNSMLAGDRLFVDLLPDTWTGAPPPLPQDIVEDLARRAREADKKMRQEKAAERRPPVAARVRVARQPTFSRYVFELPELIAVSSQRAGDKLTLTFDAVVKFDLADVKSALPPTVQAINSAPSNNNTSVTFDFIGKIDIRSFREDNNYVVDVLTPAEPGKVADARRLPLMPEGAERGPGPNVPSSGLAVSVLEGRPTAEKPAADAVKSSAAGKAAQTSPPAASAPEPTAPPRAGGDKPSPAATDDRASRATGRGGRGGVDELWRRSPDRISV